LALNVPLMEALNKASEAVGTVESVCVDGEGTFKSQALNGMPLTHTIVFEPSGNHIELTLL
jgi:hypothetical protein